MSFGVAKGSVFLAAAVRHVVTNAKQYHNMIERAHLKDPVLRAIFATTREGEVMQRRASVVSLSTLSVDFARCLRQLLETCNRFSQFVCWASVETEGGEVLDHVTLLIDKYEDRPVWEGEVHVPVETRRPRTSPLSSPTETGPVRRHSLSPPRRHSTGVSPGAHYTSTTSGIDDGRDEASLQEALREASFKLGATHNNNITRSSGGGGGEGESDGDCEGRPRGGGTMMGEELAQRLTDIMTVALLTSKAAAKLVARVDDAHSRLDALVDMATPMTSGPSPQEVMDRVLSTLASMELRTRLIEEHLAVLELGRRHRSRLPRPAAQGEAGFEDDEEQRHVAVQVHTTPWTRSAFTQTESFDVPPPPPAPLRAAGTAASADARQVDGVGAGDDRARSSPPPQRWGTTREWESPPARPAPRSYHDAMMRQGAASGSPSSSPQQQQQQQQRDRSRQAQDHTISPPSSQQYHQREHQHQQRHHEPRTATSMIHVPTPVRALPSHRQQQPAAAAAAARVFPDKSNDTQYPPHLLPQGMPGGGSASQGCSATIATSPPREAPPAPLFSLAAAASPPSHASPRNALHPHHANGWHSLSPESRYPHHGAAMPPPPPSAGDGGGGEGMPLGAALALRR